MIAGIAYAIQAFTEIPGLIKAGIDIIDFIESTKKTLALMQDENRDPTPAEWAALDSQIAALRAQLNAE